MNTVGVFASTVIEGFMVGRKGGRAGGLGNVGGFFENEEGGI